MLETQVRKHTRRSPPSREPNLHNKTRCGVQRAGCPPDTEPITCSQIIACQSLSDSLRHRAAIIEMRRDHNVTGKRVSGMNNSDFAPCEECLRVEADGWRSHGPGWNGLYGGDCGLNLEWAHTYSGRPESECVIPVKPHLRIYWKQGIKLGFLVLFFLFFWGRLCCSKVLKSCLQSDSLVIVCVVRLYTFFQHITFQPSPLNQLGV